MHYPKVLLSLIFVALFVFSGFVFPSFQDTPPENFRLKHFNLEDRLAIEGYDPVSYFQGQPKEGKESLAVKYLGITYYFSSAQNKQKFQQNPERYLPQYGGWCAYAMGEKGEKMSVDPETFKIVNGKLYLFYNAFFNNTLKSWNQNESGILKKADQEWSKFK